MNFCSSGSKIEYPLHRPEHKKKFGSRAKIREREWFSRRLPATPLCRPFHEANAQPAGQKASLRDLTVMTDWVHVAVCFSRFLTLG
jgi:hypothetical protein